MYAGKLPSYPVQAAPDGGSDMKTGGSRPTRQDVNHLKGDTGAEMALGLLIDMAMRSGPEGA